MEKGYIHVYTGDGKGKTTAAMGLALRASGRGLSVFIGQFMKGQHYGELAALRQHSLIRLEQFGDPGCIHRDEVTQAHKDMAMAGIHQIYDIYKGLAFDVVILDEICVAVWFDLVPESVVLDIMAKKPEKTELVLTGRKASPALIAKADLVTEMKEIRHYYNDRKVVARVGIEN